MKLSSYHTKIFWMVTKYKNTHILVELLKSQIISEIMAMKYRVEWLQLLADMAVEAEAELIPSNDSEPYPIFEVSQGSEERGST